MPLVKMSDLLIKAKNEGYAVGSFSVANMEMVLGVLKALEETKSPAIIQIAEVRLNHSPLELIGPLMVAAAKNSTVPVAVHFDHGKTEEKIRQALAGSMGMLLTLPLTSAVCAAIYDKKGVRENASR